MPTNSPPCATKWAAPADTPLVVTDTSDPASLQALMDATRLVLTTVGPYQLYGNELVAACAKAGVDYVDLCGEPAWMRQMIDAHEAAAKASGARIVFSCGFDSIPFDLGVFLLQKEFRHRFGHPAPRVRGRVRKMKGTFSGRHRREPQGHHGGRCHPARCAGPAERTPSRSPPGLKVRASLRATSPWWTRLWAMASGWPRS